MALTRPLPLNLGWKIEFAADGRHPDAVAIITDAADHAVHKVPHPRCVEAAEAQ
jgi:hypothetical protein